MIGSTAKVFTDIETYPGGYAVNATPTANNIPVLDASARLPYPDGWTPAVDTWTYASASTINVPSGAASIYQKGDRIKWTQTTVKYGVIVAVTDALLTIAVNTDYVVTNAAISAIYYSHQANPMGYPQWFNYTPTYTGFSSAPTIAVARFNIIGTMVTVEIRTSGSGASNQTYFTITAPVVSKTITGMAWWGAIAVPFDNNANVATGVYYILSNDTVFNLFKSAQSSWTASSNKDMQGSFLYEI
jgi:hypothetical protein